MGLIALAASIGGLLNDFVYDDLPIISENVRLHDLARWREIFSSPYWPPPYVEQLYRPIATFLLALEYGIGGGSPLVFRLVSYALYVAAALAVHRLASRMLPPTAALAAGALFAVHPVHVEAVALGVNQGEIIVGLIAVVMVIRYLDARRNGRLDWREWAILGGLYAVAALGKENGFVLPGLLVCVEVSLVRDQPWSSRLRQLAPGYAAMAVIAAGLLAWRAHVLPDNTLAVIPAVDLRGMTLADRVVAMLQVVPTWLRLLAFPAKLRVDYHLTEVPWQSTSLELLGVCLLACACILAALARRRAPAVTFGLAWCVVALLPVSNLIPTGVLVGERTLFLASVGFVIAAAGVAVWVLTPEARREWRRHAITALVVAVAAGAWKSTVRHRVWNSAHLRVVGPPRKD